MASKGLAPTSNRGRVIYMAAVLVMCVVVTAPTARADTISQNTGGFGAQLIIPGNSLTTPAGGAWNNVTFNWFEIARNSVESQRPSTLLDYAAAAWLASGFRETVLAKEASSSGISRNPRTLRNCLSATSSPDPTQRSI